MNKKQARDQMVALIFTTELGKYKDKKTGEVITLETLTERELFKKMNAVLQEKGISRKSVYKTIECKSFFMDNPDVFAPHLKRMRDFCYSKLEK